MKENPKQDLIDLGFELERTTDMDYHFKNKDNVYITMGRMPHYSLFYIFIDINNMTRFMVNNKEELTIILKQLLVIF